MNVASIRIRQRILPLMGLLALLGAASAQTAWADIPELTVTVSETGVVAPESLPAGYYRLIVDDRTELMPEVFFVRAEPGVDALQISEALQEVEHTAHSEHVGVAVAALDAMVDMVGGRGIPEDVVIELQPGDYLLMTSLEDGQGGNVHAAIRVLPNPAAPQPPAADLRVDLIDFGFHLDGEVRAGEQTWQVRNVGAQFHHLIVFRMAEGAGVEDLFAFFESEGPPSGPPPFEHVMASEVLGTAVSNYVRLDLAPGDYLAICFLPDYDSGAPHVALGMVHPFSVGGD